MSLFAILAFALILARAIAELWLSRLNKRHVRAHADEVPPAFREMVDQPTYRRSVDYTLAKSRFGEVVTLFDAALLTGLLYSRCVAVGVCKIHGSFRHVHFANGRFSFRYRSCIKHRQFAIRVVRAVQTRRPIRFHTRLPARRGCLIV